MLQLLANHRFAELFRDELGWDKLPTSEVFRSFSVPRIAASRSIADRIARERGLTRERVRQIQAAAEKKPRRVIEREMRDLIPEGGGGSE